MNKERTANIVQGFSPVILQTLKKKKVLQFCPVHSFLGHYLSQCPSLDR